MSEKPERKHVGRTVRKEIRIRADPRAVWEAWAEPDRIARWFVDSAEGSMATDDVVKWRFDDFGYELPIEVFERREGEYLAFGGEVPGRPPALTEVTLESDGGHTILRLANSGFGDGGEWDDEYEGTDSGWVLALATLRHWLENYAGESRTKVFLFRPLALEYEALQPLFATREGLEQWLAREARLDVDPLRPGAAVELELQGAGSLTGEVLARTRELLLSWKERHGALGLKAFKMGPQHAIALHFTGWGLSAIEAAAVRSELEGAFERLVAAVPAPRSTTTR